MTIPKIDLAFETSSLTTQEIAHLPFVGNGDVKSHIACFDIHGAQNPWQGWANKDIDFDFTLNNPTFVVDKPNGLAVHIIWNEDDPARDYTSEGIEIIGGQAIAGPNGTNPVFMQADKRDSLAADIPISIQNTSYTGFTERVFGTGYTPMNIVIQNNIYSVASGQWNDPNIWSSTPDGAPGITIPDQNDDVHISGHQVIIDNNQKCNSILISNDQPGSELVVQNGLTTVRSKIEIQNLNRENGECKLKVVGNGTIEISEIEP